MKELNKVMSGTDWKLLSHQKLALIEQLNSQHYSADPDPLQGLLNWIDAIQDAASSDGFPVVWLSDDKE